MANAEDFAENEWAAVCAAAHGAGLAMMLVGLWLFSQPMEMRGTVFS